MIKGVELKRSAKQKNRVSENVEQACVEMAVEHPAYGQERAMNELRKKGVIISYGGVYGRGMILRLLGKDLRH